MDMQEVDTCGITNTLRIKMIETFFMFCIGLLIGIMIDFVWWNINYSKYEKGFEALEHYHFGIILGVFGILFNQILFFGIMIMLILKESDQSHPFAIRSGHFKSSSIIGITTFIFLIAVYSIWN